MFEMLYRRQRGTQTSSSRLTVISIPLEMPVCCSHNLHIRKLFFHFLPIQRERSTTVKSSTSIRRNLGLPPQAGKPAQWPSTPKNGRSEIHKGRPERDREDFCLESICLTDGADVVQRRTDTVSKGFPVRYEPEREGQNLKAAFLSLR